MFNSKPRGLSGTTLPLHSEPLALDLLSVGIHPQVPGNQVVTVCV